MLRSGFWLLLPWLLGACALPANTALRDWSRLAETTVARPAAAPLAEGMQQALAAYFQALVTLSDGGPLAFDATRFADLAAGQAEAEASAIRQLGDVLRAASEATPPRWLARDNAGPTPAPEDRRLPNLIRGAAGPVRTLLLALAPTAADPVATALMPASPVADPALRQTRLEEARAQQAAVLDHILAAQAGLAADAERVRQRATERRLLLATQELRRRLQAQEAWP